MFTIGEPASKEVSELDVKLVTGRTIEQGVGKERGKASKEYADSVSVCYIDPEDLKKLGIGENHNVLISTQHGSVVVRALRSLRGPHAGLIFMPYGPWANAAVNPNTDSVGMPSLKGIPAEVSPAIGKSVSSLTELLKKQFAK